MSRLPLVIALLSLSSSRLVAQAVEIHPGTRVRIEAPGALSSRLEGTVVSHTADSMVVVRESTVYRLSLGEVSRLEVHTGKDRLAGARRGALIGGVIGVGWGILVVASGFDEPLCYTEEPCGEAPPAGETIVASTGAGAVWGGLIGAWVGRKRWDPVPGPARLAVAPAAGGGMNVGLRWNW